VPYTWLGFSTATTPSVAGKTPLQLRDLVAEIAGRSGGELIELYFDVGTDVAYALFRDLGGSIDTKRASHELGGVMYTKLLDAQQADDALQDGAA
jgi:hypothetical protein